MKIVMISGSNNRQGKTATMAEALLKGAENEGCQCERFFLPEMRIERCRQCNEMGWGECRQKGSCVIEDDFAALVGKIREADAAVFATPVYWGDLSESMRALLDRLRRVTRHESVKSAIDGKPAIGICVAGGSGGGAPFCAESLQKTLTISGFDMKDVVPVKRQNMELKAQVLETTGRWLANQKPA
jgi:multimeric flavodoxin WrbA